MALSRSLAMMAFIVCLSVAMEAPAQEGDDALSLIADSRAKTLEQIAREANELKAALRWSDFRAKVKAAEKIHREQSEALAKQRAALDQAQQELDASLAKIERPQLMVQILVAEVVDLDDAVLKAACVRLNAEPSPVATTDNGINEPEVWSLGAQQAGRLLATIEKRRHVQMISRPSILTLDGQQAEIFVGKQVKRPKVARAEQDKIKIEDTDENVGLGVSLTPFLQENRQIRLELVVNQSELTGATAAIAVQADGKVVSTPLISGAKEQTTVQTADGRTVLVAFKSRKPADETEPTRSTLLLLTTRIFDDRTAATGEILHH